jgi:type I restriction enzyme M protein
MLDRPNSRSVSRLLQPLGATALNLEQQVILAIQLATWAWLAAGEKISANLAPQQLQSLTGETVKRIFSELRRLPTLDENADAFITDDSVIHAVPDIVISNVVHEAQSLVSGGFIGADFVDEALTSIGNAGARNGVLGLPLELVQLLTNLLNIAPGDEVYTPFDEVLQLSLAASRSGAQVFAEISRYSPLPYLINLLTEQQVNVNVGRDPIAQPSFVDGPRLRRFTKAVAFPPIGLRLPLETADRDLYARFPERTSSSSVLAVRHILAQTMRRAVILAPNSLLFGAGVERSLRQDLVHRGLEAVIALPPAILFGTAIPLAILVLNFEDTRPAPGVLFVDGSAETFHKRLGKGRTAITGWRALADAVVLRQRGEHSTLVSSAEIAKNDYQLMVSRYIRSSAFDALDGALDAGGAVALEDIVRFIRPAPITATAPKSEMSEKVLEVGVGDLPEHGYIRAPQKRIALAALKNELRPHDILIAVKGSVGKVGIVPPDLANTWVAGQSCLILRLAPNCAHTPRSLLLYLRSAIGRACLARITSGSAVPLIQLRELRKLPVLLPASEQRIAAEEAFGQLETLQQQIAAMREQQQVLSTSLWALPDPELQNAS